MIDLTDEDAGGKFGSRLCYIPVMTECAVVDDQQQGNKGEERRAVLLYQEPGRLIVQIPNPFSMEKGIGK